MKAPYLFDEFFASGKDESISPFLTRGSQKWGKNLSLKSACVAGALLMTAFFFSFHSPILSNVFLSLVFFLAGAPALIQALHDLERLEINIDVLMTLAAFVAVLLNSALEGALLLVLFEISAALEEAVSHRTLSAIHNLNHLAPKFAHVVNADGSTFEKSVREITPGTRLLIKVGEIVPLDGKVIEGVSSLNLVHLTGETLPQAKGIGDEVPAGGRNGEAALVVEVLRTSADSTLARIAQLIMQAQASKPKLQRWLDKFGKYYATSIIALTVLFALGIPLLFSVSYWGHEGSVYRALAFLVAASPCALIIAVPTAYLSAISACARKGIVLKGGIVLDALARCKAVAFDKTGTLTTGELVCNRIEAIAASQYSENEALGIAAALERQVVHPISSAIVRLAQEKKSPTFTLDKFQSVPGYGLEGVIGTVPAYIGLVDYVAGHTSPERAQMLQKAATQGEGMCAALLMGEDLFLFRFTDRLREKIGELMTKVRKTNQLVPMMLTGDNAQNAHTIANRLGIEDVFANLRPEDKLSKVAELTASKGLAMVGDGVNDAPALARATVGISMGRIGSATAVDASDVVLLNDDLHLLSWLFSKAHSTRTVVTQNLVLALSVIGLVTTPALLGLIPLWLAVVLHEGGTLLVGLNSLRLLR